jgi:hypothetical protein
MPPASGAFFVLASLLFPLRRLVGAKDKKSGKEE